MKNEIEKVFEVLDREQELQQIRTDFAYEKFKNAEEKDKDYKKLESDYYYQNGMNNQLIVLRSMIEKELNNK